MSCCSSCNNQMCPCHHVGWLARISFGLVLAAYGVNHYRFLDVFVANVKGVYPTVPAIAAIAGVLAYIVPAFEIVGGVLFAIRKGGCIAKTCIYLSLFGILGWAGLAVLLGDASMAPGMMPMIQNTAMFVVLYYIIKKMTSCCGSSCKTGGAACSSGASATGGAAHCKGGAHCASK